jgi:hypothetical protein
MKKFFVATALFATVLTLSPYAHAEFLSGSQAHRFLSGPMLASSAPSPVELVRIPARKGRLPSVDRDALVVAVYSTLRYDSSKKSKEEIAPLVLKVVDSAEKEGIDPFIAVAIIFVESRWETKAIGDGGRACGMAQQHARFSSAWDISDSSEKFLEVKDAKLRKKKRIQYECDLLTRPDYSVKALLYHLSYIRKKSGNLSKHVWWYNGREAYLRKYGWWKTLIETSYERVLRKKALEKRDVGGDS